MSRRRAYCLPAPPPPTPNLDAFIFYPKECLPLVNSEYASWQHELYQWAFTEAQAVVQPSILERDLLGVWN